MTHVSTVLRKDQAQNFTDYRDLNVVDRDIKWTTEGEVVKESEGWRRELRKD